MVRWVLESAPENAKYNSPMIQKELLTSLPTIYGKKNHEEVGNAKFCILVNEAVESHKEQMAIILNFVDCGGVVRKCFFEIIHVEKTSALTLKKEICKALSRHNLQIEDMRGQGYDGVCQ